MRKNIVCDTFIFVEIYKGTRNARAIKNYLGDKAIVISELTLYEIYKKFLIEKPHYADEILDETIVNADRIVEVTRNILLRAAELSVKYKLAMGDSIIFATAEQEKAEFFTGDRDFHNKGISEVKIKEVGFLE